MRGFKDHSPHMLALDEVMGLELFNLSKQLKMKLGIDHHHQVTVGMSNDLCFFRGMELDGEEKPKRQNAKDTKAHSEPIVLPTKPEANKWLQLTPRTAALGKDIFERGLTMITKIHAYLVIELNLAENEGEKSKDVPDNTPDFMDPEGERRRWF